jgi:hypothetical protein
MKHPLFFILARTDPVFLFYFLLYLSDEKFAAAVTLPVFFILHYQPAAAGVAGPAATNPPGR